jgi:hypothetical protein
VLCSGSSTGFAFEGIEVVANPLAGPEAAFFFFLFGAMPGQMVSLARNHEE